MRIGINISDDLYERFKPLKGVYNLSQVCRDAVKARLESYDKAQKQATADNMQELAGRFFQEYIKRTVLDWEAIGMEYAKKWADRASLEDFENLFHNINLARGTDREPGESEAWGIKYEDRFEGAQQKYDEWFTRMFDLDPNVNHFAVARTEYDRGWISYLTAVWQMLQDRIKADFEAREKSKQNRPRPELPIGVQKDIKMEETPV